MPEIFVETVREKGRTRVRPVPGQPGFPTYKRVECPTGWRRGLPVGTKFRLSVFEKADGVLKSHSAGIPVTDEEVERALNPPAPPPHEPTPETIEVTEEELPETGIEGRETYAWATRIERNKKLRDAAIRYHGLACMGCGFSFERAYGDHGTGFIEVHHVTPVSELAGPTEVNVAHELVVLCSNCHRMVHRDREHPLSLDALRALVGAANP
jgi:hypothetical protein